MRIALVTQSFNSEVTSLAHALIAQQNDVLILTDKKTAQQQLINLPVFSPFKNWTVLETLKMFPRLLMQMPDVVHFVFTHKNEHPVAAHWLLAQLIQPLPRKVVACSFFYSAKEIKSLSLSGFLKSCHLVTFAARSHLLHAQRQVPQLKTAVLDVVPPMSILPLLIPTEPSVEVEKLTAALGDYFVVPGLPQDFISEVNLASQDFTNPVRLLFLGQRQKKYAQDPGHFYLGEVSATDLHYVLQKSLGFLLAFSDLSVLELQQYHQWSSRSKTPILCRSAQNDLFPGLVLPGKSGWIIEGMKAIRDLLLMNPSLKLPRRSEDETAYDLTDSTANELNRLYHRTIQLRS